MNKIPLRIRQAWSLLVTGIAYLLTNPQKRLAINACIDFNRFLPLRLCHLNLGDELNCSFLGELTGKRIFSARNLQSALFKMKNYACIGSIVDDRIINSYSIIWGAGAMYGTAPLSHKPEKICAVRGPLTRRFLLKQGIECPEVYGDPALLLPIVYKPKRRVKYEIGIIPHYHDFDNKVIQAFVSKHSDKICVLDIAHYGTWRDFVDQINECKLILSSSLHGIIISDAYGVPNVWLEFSDLVEGKGFKFRDYFGSVHREQKLPIRIKQEEDLEAFIGKEISWEQIDWSPRPLIEACPFEILDKYKSTFTR